VEFLYIRTTNQDIYTSKDNKSVEFSQARSNDEQSSHEWGPIVSGVLTSKDHESLEFQKIMDHKSLEF